MQLVTPDIGLLFWMLVSFMIVFFVLKKFAWKPILGMLHQREDTIEQALKAAEKAAEDMAKMQADNENVLNEARAERDKMFREAREIKEKIISEARGQAQNEKDKILEDARASIRSEKDAVIKEIREIAADLSVQIAEKLLRHELSGDDRQKDLLDRLTKDIPMN